MYLYYTHWYQCNISETYRCVENHETCGTYATVPLTTTLAFEIAGSSPSIAEISDVFPSPVLPTIATKLPTGISKLTSDNVGLSAW